MALKWPDRWQAEAISALAPFVDTDSSVDLLVGDPSSSLSGSRLAGHVFSNGREVWIIHDRSGRADVYPWPLLAGPVLEIRVREPGHRGRRVYVHPDWAPH